MLNEIIKGVSMKLSTAFGDKYKFYQNDVEQGLNPPCFFLSVLKPELSALHAQRYMGKNPLDVQYIPEDPGNNAEMIQIAGDLIEQLEFITLPSGDLLHGTGMSFEVVDGVLHVFVNYNLPMIRPTDTISMENVSVAVDMTKG